MWMTVKAFRFATLHKVASYLMAALGLGTLVSSQEMGLAARLLVVVGLTGSWFCEGPLLTGSRWIRFWNIATVLALAVQVSRALLGTSPIAAGVEFAAFLQLNRLCNRRSARDYQQITVLAFLHLVAATVLVSDLSYALCFAGFVLVSPWALSLGHLRREIEGNYLVEHRPGAGAAQVEVGRILNSRRIIGPGFLLATAALAIPLFAITASLFLLFPRLGIGIFAGAGRSATHLTGFSDRVELGGFGVIRTDPTVVMRIELPPSLGRPPRLGMYWKGTSFDRYDGKSWSRTDGSSRLLLTDGRSQHMLTRFGNERDYRIRIFLEPIEPPVLFLPEGTVAVGVPPSQDGGSSAFRVIDRFDGDELRYRDISSAGLRYDVFVTAPDGWPRPRALDGGERKRYLQLPRLDPRVRELAERITRGATSDAQRAERIARYLREHFRYTLQLPGEGAQASIDEFLLRRKRGHCEYFSTAMSTLLRIVGVPARNVTGFFGGELNRYGGFYALRQSDAHSWVEAYLEGRGWRTFDPTPASRSEPPGGGLGTAIGDALDALRLRWMQYVLSYGLTEQVAISRSLVHWLHGARLHVEGVRRGPGPVAALVALLVLATLGAVVFTLRRRGRVAFPWRRRLSGQGREPQPVVLYRKLDKAMARAGHARASGTTPLEHARVLREQGATGWQVVAFVTDRYVNARFGGKALAPGELREIEDAIAEYSRS